MFALDAEGCDNTVNIRHPGNEAGQVEPPCAFGSAKTKFFSNSSITKTTNKENKQTNMKATRNHLEKNLK